MRKWERFVTAINFVIDWMIIRPGLLVVIMITHVIVALGVLKELTAHSYFKTHSKHELETFYLLEFSTSTYLLVIPISQTGAPVPLLFPELPESLLLSLRLQSDLTGRQLRRIRRLRGFLARSLQCQIFTDLSLPPSLSSPLVNQGLCWAASAGLGRPD